MRGCFSFPSSFSNNPVVTLNALTCSVIKSMLTVMSLELAPVVFTSIYRVEKKFCCLFRFIQPNLTAKHETVRKLSKIRHQFFLRYCGGKEAFCNLSLFYSPQNETLLLLMLLSGPQPVTELLLVLFYLRILSETKLIVALTSPCKLLSVILFIFLLLKSSNGIFESQASMTLRHF